MGGVLGFLLLICLLGLRCSAQQSLLPDSEKAALRAIASKLRIGPEVWNFSENPCNGRKGGWINVPAVVTLTVPTVNVTCGNCDAISGICHVIGIELKSMNLTGVLSPEFANLTRLSVLDLSRNVLTGTIPPAWGSLPLDTLILLGNRISGTIPDVLGNITTLFYLNLEDNLLEGRIPSSFGNLKRLNRLLLSANDLVGEIPETLGNLVNLVDFRIDGNGISGMMPSFIGNWTLLTLLDLKGTSLEGPFPMTLENLRKLNILRVTDFKGDGVFPPLKGMNLKTLVLRNCSISGPIPDYLGSMSNLQILDLSFNSFSGGIPSTFQLGMQHIKYMYLTNNLLNGTIPVWLFGDLSLDLSYNFFTGPYLSKCQDRDINLVSSFSSMTNSVTWCLMKNLPCFKKASNYQLFINCGGGMLTIDGNDYEEDRNPSGLSTFFLADSGKWAYSSTGIFNGDANGEHIVANASALNITSPQLYMSARTSASSLRYYGFCLQRGNYTVKLHFAEIKFVGDNRYPSVGRRFFDVFIQGRKVLEDFNIADAAKGAGREVVMPFNASVDSTLVIDFRWSGKGSNAIPNRGVYGPLISAISVTPNFIPEVDKRKHLSVSTIAGIATASCLLIFLIMLVTFFLLHRRWKRSDENVELKGMKLQGSYYSLKQIQAATKKFDVGNKIGQGGFGSVYKGILPDGSAIAVKQLSSRSKQGNREFVNEIGMISALDHPNLVKLYGCCIEGDQLLLVYEYMENNSLTRALFGPEETRLDLDWQTRRKISLHIARGLAYLHEESRLKIVHRDIKGTNILLDKDMNAKISDFGLAKLDDEERSHISTRVAGTIGYMAPEYASRGHLSEKADVYSFGIVLLEIVSGKRNGKETFNDDHMCLLDRANALQEQGKLLQLVDTRLGSDYPREEALQMLNLAISCTNLSPGLRPTMTSVAQAIEEGTPVQIPVPKPFDSPAEAIIYKDSVKLLDVSQQSVESSIYSSYVSSSSANGISSTIALEPSSD